MDTKLSAREAFDKATYKQAADKIRQILSAIKNNPASSAKRWVWELMQNAKDIPNKFGKVSIEIELVSENELRFKHNGNPFAINNITGLIRQVSSKNSLNENEETTGKFGTGFICTHLLSDVIDVNGVLDYDGYRNFVLQLDRSGRSSEELMPRIQEVEKIFLEPDVHFKPTPNYEENRKENDFDTVFVYHLTSNEKYKAATAGLDDLVNTLPITLVTQSKRIKQVHVIDRVRNTDVTYVCESKELDENVTFSEIRINTDVKQYLSYITSEVALTIEVSKTENGYILHKRDNKQPVLYRDFPLIGSEEFYFPYTLNGFRLCPTEKRNSIPLNGEDNWEAKENREIINHAVETSLKFNEWLIAHNAINRYLIAYSPKPKAEVDYDEDIALPWINELQTNWRKQLLRHDLVESLDGIHKVKEISVPSFSYGASEDFFDLLDGFYIGRGYLPLKEHQKGWLKILNSEYKSWGMSLKYEKEEFLRDLSAVGNVSALSEKLAKSQEEVFSWLNKVYAFLIKQNCKDDFDKYKIIPNEDGTFRFLKDLSSDHTSKIPTVLKGIYNYVMTETIQSWTINENIEATIFGDTLKTFNLNNIINWFNAKIKSSDTYYKNGTSYYSKYPVAYELLTLYPSSIEDSKYLSHRRKIYDFSAAYANMSDYTAIEVSDTDLWREADIFWFNNSYKSIESAGNITKVAEEFFVSPKTQDETLLWMNEYLKFYRETSNGDLIASHKVFPNQRLELKTLSDLRYDNDVAEEFKDLANYAYNSDYRYEYYRHKLLHRSILGYEQHNPLTVKEVYEFVKGQFDKGSCSVKNTIAKHALAILLINEENISSEKVLYDFLKTFYADSMPEVKYIDSASGFNWSFVQEFYLDKLCYDISTKIDIDKLRAETTSFIDKSNIELIEWIDSLIDFLRTYKAKKYWPIITDAERGRGIWLNQKNCFCKFKDVRRDDNIPEELKDIVTSNRHIGRDLRSELYSLDSKHSNHLETYALTLEEVGKFVDEKIQNYEGSMLDNDFRSLVFNVGKLCKQYTNLENYMSYFKDTKNSLIVWTLGEGETMDLVGSIVQQGDEKLKVVKDILEGNSLEDLKNIKTVLQGCPADQFDKVRDFVEKLTSENTPNIGGEIPTGGNDKVIAKIEYVPETYEVDVIDYAGRNVTVKTDQVQYAGLSLEEIEKYVTEAKAAVVKKFKDLNEQYDLGLQFDNERIAMHSYSQLYGISDRNGKEIPLVVHSYKGPQYRYFDLNWYDWQMLSRPGSMLWVLTVKGLQCIPLYALPVRKFNIQIDDKTSDEARAALLTLAAVGKQYSHLSFDFGNNMPQGFTMPLAFDYVPDELENCIDSIKKVCDENLPLIANLYNSAKNIPIVHSTVGYSIALKEYEETGNIRDEYEAPLNEVVAPSIGTGYFD